MFCDSMMLGGGRKAAFSIENSVRMDGANDYFTRTPGTPGNRKTWTFSIWFKRSSLIPPVQVLFGSINGSGEEDSFALFPATNESLAVTSGTTIYRTTSQVLRDTTAWQHVVLSVDTTQTDPANRLRLFVNGTEVIAFDALVPPSQDREFAINTTAPHTIGSPTYLFNGYIAYPILVDGHVLAPTAFGETDPVTGSWCPKKPQISEYGTNGFALDFATPADLGRDVSGKANHWNPVSLGAADVVADSPTNNYATLNPLQPTGDTGTGVSVTYGKGNTTYSYAGGGGTGRVMATMSCPVKTYAELSGASTSDLLFGIVAEDWSEAYMYMAGNGGVYHYVPASSPSPSLVTTYSGWGGSDIVQLAFDPGAGALWFGKNNTFNGNPTAGTGQAVTGLTAKKWHISSGYGGASGTHSASVNFGAASFAYTPPTGFKALCTANLPTPSIQSPAKFMDVVTYTGTGAARSVGGLGFQPDLVWIKARNSDTNHSVYDSVRGVGQRLETDTTDAEAAGDNGVSAFNSNGFSLGTQGQVNASGISYAAWCWKAGDSTIANTSGTIASQVRANPQAGFSIVTYTGIGQGNAATVGHGLGSTPKFIMVKSRTNGADNNWTVYHQAIGATGAVFLNNTVTVSTSVSYWNDTNPTSNVFSIRSNKNDIGVSYITYCWSEIDGFSKFGSYTGNGSADGPFVYCGFRPRFILIKNAGFATNWSILDMRTNPDNPTVTTLFPNSSEVQSSPWNVDALANGFKIRNASQTMNYSGYTILFAAFAEAPLGGIKTAPAKAR